MDRALLHLPLIRPRKRSSEVAGAIFNVLHTDGAIFNVLHTDGHPHPPRLEDHAGYHRNGQVVPRTLRVIFNVVLRTEQFIVVPQTTQPGQGSNLKSCLGHSRRTTLVTTEMAKSCPGINSQRTREKPPVDRWEQFNVNAQDNWYRQLEPKMGTNDLLLPPQEQNSHEMAGPEARPSRCQPHLDEKRRSLKVWGLP